MTRDDLERRILDVVRSEKTLPDIPFTIQTPLQDLGVDSLDALNILFALEEAFGITIPDEASRHIVTLDDLITVIEAELSARP